MIDLVHRINAEEALRLGLVSRVVEPEELVLKAVELAHKISSFSQPAVAKAKECVNMAEQVSLTAGLTYERSVQTLPGLAATSQLCCNGWSLRVEERFKLSEKGSGPRQLHAQQMWLLGA